MRERVGGNLITKTDQLVPFLSRHGVLNNLINFDLIYHCFLSSFFSFKFMLSFFLFKINNNKVFHSELKLEKLNYNLNEFFLLSFYVVSILIHIFMLIVRELLTGTFSTFQNSTTVQAHKYII